MPVAGLEQVPRRWQADPARPQDERHSRDDRSRQDEGVDLGPLRVGQRLQHRKPSAADRTRAAAAAALRALMSRRTRIAAAVCWSTWFGLLAGQAVVVL